MREFPPGQVLIPPGWSRLRAIYVAVPTTANEIKSIIRAFPPPAPLPPRGVVNGIKAPPITAGTRESTPCPRCGGASYPEVSVKGDTLWWCGSCWNEWPRS